MNKQLHIMGSTVFFFNPDHDLALANNDPNYMPPAAARQLTADLALFPVWYGGEKDFVLAPSKYNKSFLDERRAVLPVLPSLITPSELAGKTFNLSPWGWNPAICKKMLEYGVSANNLPSSTELEYIRQYSHRLQAVNLLSGLNDNNYCCGTSCYLTDQDSIRKFVESSGFCVLKAPLSGSGKGLNWCKGEFTYHIEHWCENILNKQGGVVAEPSYNKVQDFAMQFHTDAVGEITFAGYSFFETNASGAYMGNVLATDDDIETRLSHYVPVESLDKVRQAIVKELNGTFAGVYRGYFGVDMMICAFNDEPRYRLHPCVEINLRMTMGMASRLFYDKYVKPGATGVFRLEYHPSADILKSEVANLEKEYPLFWVDDRIAGGYFPLVPVTPNSRYHAWVEINTE